MPDTDTAMRELAEQAAQRLSGTCMLVMQLGEEFEGADNDDDFCRRLDELVFCCEGCDWWFDQSEMAESDARDRWVCEECAE